MFGALADGLRVHEAGASQRDRCNRGESGFGRFVFNASLRRLRIGCVNIATSRCRLMTCANQHETRRMRTGRRLLKGASAPPPGTHQCFIASITIRRSPKAMRSDLACTDE